MYKSSPSGFFVSDWISQHFMSIPNKVIFIDLISKQKWLDNQINTHVSKLTGYFMILGIKKNDQIDFLVFNSTDILEIIFVCWRFGIIELTLNFRLTAIRLSYIINNPIPKAIFLDSALDLKWKDTRQLTQVEHVIKIDGSLYLGNLNMKGIEKIPMSKKH